MHGQEAEGVKWRRHHSIEYRMDYYDNSIMGEIDRRLGIRQKTMMMLLNFVFFVCDF